MRVVSYNIRNVRALDPASWWWRRRGRVRKVIDRLAADVVALQEAYPSQIRYLRRAPCSAPAWQVVGRGRNRSGRGEAVPIFTRADRLARREDATRWFGPAPERAGARDDGASHPRIVTTGVYDVVAGSSALTIANLHLDPASVRRRESSVAQLVDWLAPHRDGPLVVLGDFNGPLAEPWHATLTATGLRSALDDGIGPTANGYGDPGGQQQIDHVFVSVDIEVRGAFVDTTAGFASDHYPVVADLVIP